MLDKKCYINLLKEKKYDEIVLRFKDDFKVLFIKILDKNSIKYEKDKSYLYYSTIISKYFPELAQKIIFLNSRINDTDILSQEKVNILIDIYLYFNRKLNEI